MWTSFWVPGPAESVVIPMNVMHHRLLISLILLGFLASGSPTTTRDARATDERRLSFYHTHTGKSLDTIYFRDGKYIESALEEINHFLGDFRTGDVAIIDPNLLDLIYDIRVSLQSDGIYEVISAYRSPKTNSILRSRSSGVAKNSQHLLGTAIDVRLEGIPIENLRDAALAMKKGGVGYYSASNFVHIDTGRVRRW